jgi:hypothetical protein
MVAPNFQEVANAYERMGYKFFKNGTYNLNIWGIRSLSSKSNKFDDIGGALCYTGINKPFLLTAPITTDPGKYWLQNPMNKNGTAILVPGQYSGSHALGYHGRNGLSPYEALEQIGEMLYVRDNNKDEILDFDLYRNPEKLKIHGFRENIKSNIHRASINKIVQLVERYSAACQVYQDSAEFAELIALVKLSLKAGFKNSFTYTLFEEDQVWS